MNLVLTSLEMAVLALGIGLVLLDLWTPPAMKRSLGYAAACALGVILIFSFSPYFTAEATRHAFGTSYVMDGLALYFKRFFLVAAGLVLVMVHTRSTRSPTWTIAFRAGTSTMDATLPGSSRVLTASG